MENNKQYYIEGNILFPLGGWEIRVGDLVGRKYYMLPYGLFTKIAPPDSDKKYAAIGIVKEISQKQIKIYWFNINKREMYILNDPRYQNSNWRGGDINPGMNILKFFERIMP